VPSKKGVTTRLSLKARSDSYVRRLCEENASETADSLESIDIRPSTLQIGESSLRPEVWSRDSRNQFEEKRVYYL
jgi:hypothetical protein